MDRKRIGLLSELFSSNTTWTCCINPFRVLRQPLFDTTTPIAPRARPSQNRLADTGYYSEDNVSACAKAGVVPYIACGREPHYPPLAERLAGAPQAPENPDPVSVMRHRLKTAEGKAHYAKRKSTVEPVFGIIKHVIGFRQFMLRGLKAVQGEWTLLCIAFNLKRLHTLKGVKKAAEVAASMLLSVLRLARRCLYPTTWLPWPGRKARTV